MIKMKDNLIKDFIELLLGRKGGKTTIRIIDKLLEHPYNINQLSEVLDFDYKTIQYHLNLVVNTNFVNIEGNKYGSLYFPTDKLKNNLKEYDEIKNYVINMKK